MRAHNFNIREFQHYNVLEAWRACVARTLATAANASAPGLIKRLGVFIPAWKRRTEKGYKIDGEENQCTAVDEREDENHRFHLPSSVWFHFRTSCFGWTAEHSPWWCCHSAPWRPGGKPRQDNSRTVRFQFNSIQAHIWSLSLIGCSIPCITLRCLGMRDEQSFF